MNNNLIKKYNEIVENIVKEFSIRYYNECFNEDEYDYEIMDYQ